MAPTDTNHALRRIADALEMPVSVFTDSHAARPTDPSVNAVELLRLFDRIPDEQKRRECIEFVRRMAR